MKSKPNLLKEWIIFALCIGAGAHIALGLVLHAPERWPVSTAWVNGFLLAVSCYICVQLIRAIYWFWKPDRLHEPDT